MKEHGFTFSFRVAGDRIAAAAVQETFQRFIEMELPSTSEIEVISSKIRALRARKR